MSQATTTKGQCLCGKVQVRLSRLLADRGASPRPAIKVTVTADKPLTSFDTLCCHCDSCKRRSGGVASYAFVVPEQRVSFHGSAHKTFEDRDTGSGKPMRRTMCAECGSPVCVIEADSPDMRCLQYGLFAGQVELPRPALEMFASKRVPWINEVGEDVREMA
ncbi:hypothetical protein DL768_003398 [Monosporascus sp. mg162]|nr:hypothetical protein DL768_003398 [Monosporascus sp. mg162]